MATALNLSNANGKTIILQNPDTNNSDITVEMDKVVVKDANGNVVLASGSKIQGDFSNGNNSLRTAIQTSTSNSATRLEILPNGSSTSSSVHVRNSQDAINSSLFSLGITSTESQVNSTISGTGTYLPIAFYTGGSGRMRIDTSGNVGIGTSSPAFNLDIINTSTTGTTADNTIIHLKSSNRNCGYLMDTIGGVYAGSISNYVSGVIKSQLKFDSTGNILSIFPNGGLGYGIGAGGTVTQLTSKNTAVELNKPCGAITMNNAALAAGASVEFILNNTVFNTSADSLYVITGSYGYNYTVEAKQYNTAQFLIRVKNISAGSLSEPLEIKFVLIKGAIA